MEGLIEEVCEKRRIFDCGKSLKGADIPYMLDIFHTIGWMASLCRFMVITFVIQSIQICKNISKDSRNEKCGVVPCFCKATITERLWNTVGNFIKEDKDGRKQKVGAVARVADFGTI